MIIIIEGTDRSGKSHVAAELSKITGIPRLQWDGVRNLGIKDLHNSVLAITSKLSADIILSFLKIHKEDLILERGPFCDIVYSKVFNRPCLLKQRSLEARYKDFVKLYVLLVCSEKELRRRFKRAPDKYVTADQAIEIQKEYLKFFEKSKLRKVKIFCDGMTPTQIAEKIKTELEQ